MYDKTVHHRRSIRLHGYDYSIPDYYFITICAQDKKCIFGRVCNGEMALNEFGKIVCNSWEWLAEQYEYIKLHEYVVMPNHFHGIIEICDVGARRDAPYFHGIIEICNVGARRDAPRAAREPPLQQPVRTKKIGGITGAFKTVSTKQINIIRGTPGKKLWQRNYYEHIIRDGADYEKIMNYIVSNPQTWDSDKLYQKQLDEFNKRFE